MRLGAKRRKGRTRAFVAAAALVLSAAPFVIPGCAGGPPAGAVPERPPEARSVSDGLEMIEGRGWTAVRASVPEGGLELALAARFDEDGRLLGGHGTDDFEDAAVEASMVGSPHHPVRFRSGLPQAVSGFFRLGGTTVSEPDGRHDALGLDEGGTPFLLRPEDQERWTGDAAGGFFAVLADGEVLSPVDNRDAVGAVGWTDGGSTVVFFVSRGRKGSGLTYREAGEILRSLGAEDALAMDGGGSVRLAWRDGGGIVSYPDRPLYRAVPNRLVLVRR